MSRAWPSLAGALALAMPVLPVSAGAISVAVCGLPGAAVTIPVDRAPADEHGCCRDRACHSACERKRQGRQGVSDPA